MRTVVFLSLIILFGIIVGCIGNEASQSQQSSARLSTPTPISTTQLTTTRNMPQIHWCTVKKECDEGIREQNTIACQKANAMPKNEMEQYCLNDPILSIQQKAAIAREVKKCYDGMQPSYQTCEYWEKQSDKL